MTKKKIYIHIGFGKTGTTAIQTFLSKRQCELLENGVLYPSVGQEEGGHHLLAPLGMEYISGGVADIYTELLKEIDGASARKIIISSENFIFASPGFIDDLRRKFQDYSIKIIFYVRDQVPLIESTYLEWQKVGNKYDESVRLFFLKHWLSFDFMNRIEPWVRSFGSENLIARCYDRNLIGKDVCIDFANVVGISGGVIVSKMVEANSSLRPEFSELVRLIDATEPSESERNKIISQLLAISKTFESVNKHTLVDIALEKEIRSVYMDSNIIFAQEYLPPEHCKYFIGKVGIEEM